MKKILLFLCLISIFSCTKIEPENSNLKGNTEQQRNQGSITSFNEEEGPLENPLYTTAYTVGVETLVYEYSNAKNILASDTSNLAAKKDIFISVYTAAYVAIAMNPAIEFMTSNSEIQDAVSEILFPPITPSTPGTLSPIQQCLLYAVVGLVASQTQALKVVADFIKLTTGGGLTRSLLLSLTKDLLKGVVSNASVEVGLFITAAEFLICYSAVEVHLDDLTDATATAIQASNVSAAMLAGTIQTFYDSEPTIERMKFYLLSSMSNIIESQVYDPVTNSYLTERTYNSEYYAIKNSTDYGFLASKITTTLNKVKGYLDQGNITPYELDEESL